MPAYFTGQEVYLIEDEDVEGVVLNSVINGHTNYYLVYTNEGEKRYFAEDELASTAVREDSQNSEEDEEISNAWAVSSFIDFLLHQIPENECFLHIENGFGDDYILLKFSWEGEQSAKMDIKCTFTDGSFVFHEVNIEYSINFHPLTLFNGSTRIDLGEDEEKDDCQARICKSLNGFLEQFSEYESIVAFLETYSAEVSASVIVEETETGGIEWEYSGEQNEEDSYESSDGQFNYEYAADENHDYHLYVSDGNFRICDYLDEDLSLLEAIENAEDEADEEDEEEDISTVGTKDLFVRTDFRSCYYKDHNLESLTATVSMIDFNKQKRWEESLTVFYCRECHKYYLYERDYKKLIRKGYLCCRVITIDQLVSMVNAGANWQPKSMLKQYGYSVSKRDNLSQNERQAILSFIIENDILSESRVCEYLNWFIRMADKGIGKESAIEKWETDLDFVRNYSKGNTKIRVGDIYRLKKVLNFE